MLEPVDKITRESNHAHAAGNPYRIAECLNPRWTGIPHAAAAPENGIAQAGELPDAHRKLVKPLTRSEFNADADDDKAYDRAHQAGREHPLIRPEAYV